MISSSSGIPIGLHLKCLKLTRQPYRVSRHISFMFVIGQKTYSLHFHVYFYYHLTSMRHGESGEKVYLPTFYLLKSCQELEN